MTLQARSETAFGKSGGAHVLEINKVTGTFAVLGGVLPPSESSFHVTRFSI